DFQLNPAAVMPGIGGGDDWKDLGIRDAPDASERLGKDLLLPLQLRLIVHLLPLAPTTTTEHGAFRIDSVRGLLENLRELSALVVAVIRKDGDAHMVAGNSPRHENNLALSAGDAFAAEGQTVDGQNSLHGFRLRLQPFPRPPVSIKWPLWSRRVPG